MINSNSEKYCKRLFINQNIFSLEQKYMLKQLILYWTLNFAVYI